MPTVGSSWAGLVDGPRGRSNDLEHPGNRDGEEGTESAGELDCHQDADEHRQGHAASRRWAAQERASLPSTWVESGETPTLAESLVAQLGSCDDVWQCLIIT